MEECDDAIDDVANDDDEKNHGHHIPYEEIDELQIVRLEEEEVRRSMRQTKSSSRYNTQEYVMLTNGESRKALENQSLEEPKFQIRDHVWLLRRNVKIIRPCDKFHLSSLIKSMMLL